MAHPSPTQSWKFMAPSVVSAVKFGASSLILNGMTLSPNNFNLGCPGIWVLSPRQPDLPPIKHIPKNNVVDKNHEQLSGLVRRPFLAIEFPGC
jgi:hypothetical protein